MKKEVVIYGRRVVSDFEIPEAVNWLGGNTNFGDVAIRWGKVQGRTDGVTEGGLWYSVAPEIVVWDVPRVAKYRIEGGERITVELKPHARAREMRLFLLGIVFATLLYRSGTVPFHVSGVKSSRGVVLFGGKSGVGKSTTAAWCAARYGMKLVSDDIGIMKHTRNGVIFHSGIARLKLWSDSIARLGLDDAPKLRDLTRVEKYHILKPLDFEPAYHKVFKIVVLTKENGIDQDLTGISGIQALLNIVYRPELPKLLGVCSPMEEILDMVTTRKVTVRQLSRNNLERFIEREML